MSNSGLTGFQYAAAQLSNVSSRIAHAGTAEIGMTERQKTPGSLSPFAERASFSLTTELVNGNAHLLAIKDFK